MSKRLRLTIDIDESNPDYEECFCRHDELSKMLNCIE